MLQGSESKKEAALKVKAACMITDLQFENNAHQRVNNHRREQYRHMNQ